MVDNDGKSTLSNIIPVTLENQLQFSIKPNPAKDYFIITSNISAPSHAEVNIYDLSGRIILKQVITISGEQKINISTLRKGAYIVILKPDNDNTIIQKLLVE
jgi:Secretion system C-terminal sorting domain